MPPVRSPTRRTCGRRCRAISLTIVDRGFYSAKLLIPLARGGTNRHWLIRAKSNLRWRVLRRLGPRDAIVEMTVSRGARKQDPSLPARWVALPADEIAAA